MNKHMTFSSREVLLTPRLLEVKILEVLELQFLNLFMYVDMVVHVYVFIHVRRCASTHECIWESEGHHDIITRNAVCLLKICFITVLELTSFPKLADQ